MAVVAVDTHPLLSPLSGAGMLPSRKQLTGSDINISATDDVNVVLPDWIEFLAAGTVNLVLADDPTVAGVVRTVAAKDSLNVRVRRILVTSTSLTAAQIVIHYCAP